MAVQHIEDRELFVLVAGGDEDAFRQIFHLYNSKLFPSILKLVKSEAEAEEIVQNVFLKLWLKREQLSEIENPGGWLYRIASNMALSALRSKSTHLKHLQAIKPGVSEGEDSLQLELDARELIQLVKEAVEHLPAGRKHIFLLSRSEGLDRRQIAEQTGLSENTVKNQLSSALKFIQAYIQKKHGLYLALVLFHPFFMKMFVAQ